MAKIGNFKRLTSESVEPEYRDLIQVIAGSTNDFADEVTTALNNNLTVDENLNMQYKTLEFSVAATGVPTITTQFKSTLKSRVRGMQVIKVENLTNPNVFLTGAPFITFTETNQVVTVSHITGLAVSNKYRVTVLSLG